jgi:hypothetical protein
VKNGIPATSIVDKSNLVSGNQNPESIPKRRFASDPLVGIAQRKQIMSNIYDDGDLYPEEKQASLTGKSYDSTVPGAKDRSALREILRRLRERAFDPGVSPKTGSDESSRKISLKRLLELDITAKILEHSEDFVALDWIGGHQLTIPTIRLLGDWKGLKSGDWVEARIKILRGGSVSSAMLLERSMEPESLDDKELEELYSRLQPAALEPINWL